MIGIGWKNGLFYGTCAEGPKIPIKEFGTCGRKIIRSDLEW